MTCCAQQFCDQGCLEMDTVVHMKAQTCAQINLQCLALRHICLVPVRSSLRPSTSNCSGTSQQHPCLPWFSDERGRGEAAVSGNRTRSSLQWWERNKGPFTAGAARFTLHTYFTLHWFQYLAAVGRVPSYLLLAPLQYGSVGGYDSTGQAMRVLGQGRAVTHMYGVGGS